MVWTGPTGPGLLAHASGPQVPVGRHEQPVLAKLDFPVYALAGAAADAEPAGHGWDRDGVGSVTMRHDRVAITTYARRHVFGGSVDENTQALMSIIYAAEPLDWGRGSNAARALRIDAYRRAVATRVAGAESFAVELPVDGVPVPFAGLRDAAGWAAVGDTTEVRIVLGVSGIEPDRIALHRL